MQAAPKAPDATVSKSRAIDTTTRRIPRILHQTWKSAVLPPEHVPRRQTWLDKNPHWEYRFYDDAACVAYVRERFPSYLSAYLALVKPVERADLFRYLVVLGDGGLYADIDTSCEQPLDGLIRPDDRMVVGIEQAGIPPVHAVRSGYVRMPVQVCQWAFAAEPGHPALRWVADVVANYAHATTPLHADTNTDTLLRTGPGPFTDVALWFALQGTVRIVPQQAFNPPPGTPLAAGVFVRHYFAGSWHVARPTPPVTPMAEQKSDSAAWALVAAVLVAVLVAVVLLRRGSVAPPPASEIASIAAAHTPAVASVV